MRAWLVLGVQVNQLSMVVDIAWDLPFERPRLQASQLLTFIHLGLLSMRRDLLRHLHQNLLLDDGSVFALHS